VTLKKTKDDTKEAAAKAKEALSKLESEKETIARMESYTADMAKWSKTLKDKEQSAAKIEVTEAAIDKMQKDFTAINVTLKELNTKLDSNAKSEKEKAALAKEKKAEVETVSKMQAQVRKKRSAIENIAKFKIALEETQTTLRSKLIGSINGIMQEVWPELYPYGDYRDIRLEPTSDDYVLKVKTARREEARWEEVDTIASGGEKSVACLTMRVAFALVLVPNLRWMILDEPTHNIDQLGLQRFMKAINEVLPKLVDQVFIITHDETLKEVENAKIYVMSRNKEKGEGTSVESYMA
jgi:DNA repair exonuclease SbcCD ATPase subunit